MKVLFTASTFSHIRRFHLPYLRWFQRKRWTVHVGCGGEKAPVPYADEVFPLPLEKKMTAPGNFRAAAYLRKKIQRERYDLISTHTSLAAFFTRIALKGMAERPKVVNTVHGYLFDDATPALKREILLLTEKMTAPQTDLLLTMNRWDTNLAERERLGKEISFIPGMGVDYAGLDAQPTDPALRARLYIPEDAFVLIYPAEFSPRKSQMTLLEGMTMLPEDVYLILLGGGRMLEECRAHAGKPGLSDRVVFPGEVNDAGRWMKSADVLVSSSRSEGLPFNVMEGMHLGLPVVASAVKGHIDLVEDGVNGFLYPYGDAAAFAEKVRRLREDKDLYNRLSHAAKESVNMYGLREVFPLVAQKYGKLIEGD